MIGQTISHYKIVEKLGEGGMGVVYKAQDSKLDRLVALKFLPPEYTRDPDAKQRFIHEAKSASALDHPNICTIYEVDETSDGQLFIAMAYYKGETLQQKIKPAAAIHESPLPLDDAISYANQIAEGLQAAHKKGITHRDIKSSNIMVTAENQVKIMDFGLAKTTAATMLTKTGSTIGTVPYMSPEQARGEKVDHRSDIWSLGVVLYEMISGRLPFHSPYSEAIVYSILNEEAKPFALVRNDVPGVVERIVKRCLQKNLADRYQNADELIVDLRQVKADSGKVQQKIPKPTRFQWRNWYLLGGAALLIGLLLFIFLPRFTSRDEVIHSIAVLPLENLSRDPEQEYFADGMTEALITDLAKISALRVISRTSVMHFKGTQKTIPEIAKELNVDAVVEGSVQRSGDRVRITAQLIHASTDKHLWAESYERNLTDVLALQSEVALAIAKEIRAKVTPQEETRLTSARPVNPEAHEAYLRGRFYWNKRPLGVEKAMEYFRQAIEKDPGYAPAYAGLADSYSSLGAWESGALSPREAYPKAKAAAEKALELDESLAEAHASLAYTRLNFDWDWLAAEREFKRGIELNPNYATAHHWHSHYLMAMGRTEESLAESRKAIELDPLDPIINVHLAWNYLFARRYDETIEQSQKTLEIQPNYFWSHFFMGCAYEKKGLFSEAIAEFQKATDISGGSLFAVAGLGHAYAVAGNKSQALKILDQLKSKSKQMYVGGYNIALIYVGLGERDQAFEWLEKAYEERSNWLSYFKVEPRLDSLRSDSRYIALLKKMGLQASESDKSSRLPSIEKPKTEALPKWQNSIAVLPFKNISSDKEQEYFCDGMTEAIITDLAKLSQLVVMSPSAVTPYKGKNVDVRSIEQKLRVRYVVEGSVQRSGSALRVTVQLINTESGVQMWANRFDRTIQDVFAVQDDISGKIVAALQLKLSAREQQKLGGRPTQNLEAYDLYLRGRFYQNRRSVQATDLAIPLLERATAADPNFAAAFAALGSTYTQKSFYDEPLKKDWDQKAFVAVEKALSIDPNLAEAHVAKGNLLWTPANHFPHDKAIAAYRRAIELKPSYDEAHELLGFVYYHIGLLEEGLEECRRALQINPNSAFAQSRVGVVLLYLDRNEEALAELRKVPEGFNPQIIPTQIAIALSYLERRQEAKEILNNVSKQMPEDPFLLSTQALMLAAEGRNDEALKKIDLAMKREKTYLGHFHHAAYNLGSTFALMKRNGDAVEWLRKAAEGGFPCYPRYERDSNLNNLRQDAAFRALLSDLKKQWESYRAML